MDDLDSMIELLKEQRARHGNLKVKGNHEKIIDVKHMDAIPGEDDPGYINISS